MDNAIEELNLEDEEREKTENAMANAIEDLNLEDEEREKTENENIPQETELDLEKFTVLLMNATLLPLASNVATAAEDSLEAYHPRSCIAMLAFVMCKEDKTPHEVRQSAASRLQNMLIDEDGSVNRWVWLLLGISKRAQILLSLIVATKFSVALNGDAKGLFNKLVVVDWQDTIYLIRNLHEVLGILKNIGLHDVLKIKYPHCLVVESVMPLLEVETYMKEILAMIWEGIFRCDDVPQLFLIVQGIGPILGVQEPIMAADLLCSQIYDMLGCVNPVYEGKKISPEEMCTCWSSYEMPKKTLLGAILLRMLKIPIGGYSEFAKDWIIQIGVIDIRSRIWASIRLPEMLLCMSSLGNDSFTRRTSLEILTVLLKKTGNSEIVASSDDFFRIVIDTCKTDGDMSARLAAVTCCRCFLKLHQNLMLDIANYLEVAQDFSNFCGDDDFGLVARDCYDCIQDVIAKFTLMIFPHKIN